MDEQIRILLVDDEESFYKKMSDRLSKMGFEVEVATSGPEALALAEACNGNFQVAIIDQVMGPPNGTDIMQMLHQFYAAIAIIILTGWGNMEPGEQAMELGAFRYMSKTAASNWDELVLNIRMAARACQEHRQGVVLQALLAAGQEIGAAQSADQLYQLVHALVAAHLPGLDDFQFCLFDETNQLITVPYARLYGQPVAYEPRRNGNGLAEYVLATQKPLLLADGDQAFREQNSLEPPPPERGYCTSMVKVPIFVQGRVIGTIAAMSFDPKVHYTQEHLALLQSIANQAGMALENVRQLEEARKLESAAAVLAGQRGKDNVLRAIVEEAHKLLGSDFTGLILQDEKGELSGVEPVIPENYTELFGPPRQAGGVTRAVIKTREPRVINDTRTDPLVKDAVRSVGVRSMLVMPLIHEKKVLGVLYTHTLKQRYFSTYEVNLWRTFAAIGAVALQAALDKEREFERLEIQLNTLTESRPRKETMVLVATAAKALFEADICHLIYFHPITGNLVDWAWAENDPVEYRLDEEPRVNGVTAYVLKHKTAIFISDAATSEQPSPRTQLIMRGLKSFASFPLVHGNQIIAVIHCCYLNTRRYFTESDQTLVEAFSARAAIALDRAYRDELDEIWQQLDRTLATCSDRKAVYRLFTEQARRALCADFAIFYPCDTSNPFDELHPLIGQEYVLVGPLQAAWRLPQGGLGGGIYNMLRQAPDCTLIVNELDREPQTRSHLTEREGVRAFIGLRLEVLPEGQKKPQLVGMLFLNYRWPTCIQSSDLVSLRQAGSNVAATLLKLDLGEALQKNRAALNKQLHGITEIFRECLNPRERHALLKHLAEVAKDALEMDVCVILDFDHKKAKFTERGSAGLKYPKSHYPLHSDYKRLFLDKREPTFIIDAPSDPLMSRREIVQREEFRSIYVFPLYYGEESLGLLFANYRYLKNRMSAEEETIGMFARFAALVLHETRLRAKLEKTQKRLERRIFLTLVSTLRDIWEHSLVQKAASIQNYAAIAQKGLTNGNLTPESISVPEALSEIDRLAKEIAGMPPRVPQSWEVESESLPLNQLLDEVIQAEQKRIAVLGSLAVEIEPSHGNLDGAKVYGYKPLLKYVFEALLQNARNAMPQGGKISLSSNRKGAWAEIRVQDTGTGVPDNIRARLFKEIIPRKQDKAGMGIGALLAATIIEEHEGEINLEKPGPGNTTILIRLPLRKKHFGKGARRVRRTSGEIANYASEKQ